MLLPALDKLAISFPIFAKTIVSELATWRMLILSYLYQKNTQFRLYRFVSDMLTAQSNA